MTKIKELLKNKLTKKELELVPTSFDIVGSILIFADFPKELVKKEKLIANTILKELKHVKTVCKKTKKYAGRYRTPTLKVMAGEKTKETIHKENGVSIQLDVESVYFSPRLSNERLRIAKQVKPKEDILVMFSGCGIYPIVLSKNTQAKNIYGIEINKTAHEFGLENIKLNKVKNVFLIKGNVKKIIPNLIQNKIDYKVKKFSRILMPLPKSAENYLDLACQCSKKGTLIHFYDFLHEDDFKSAHDKIKKACKNAKKTCKIMDTVKCGQYAPKTFRICVDFKILN